MKAPNSPFARGLTAVASRTALVGCVVLATGTGCSPPDLTVDGHDFHLSRALVEGPFEDQGGVAQYRFVVANVAEPCLLLTDPESVRPLDDFWLQIGGWSRLDGSPPDYGYMTMCISDRLPCNPSVGHRLYETEGDEVVVADGERLSFSATFRDQYEVEEPFVVELDLPYTTCE